MSAGPVVDERNSLLRHFRLSITKTKGVGSMTYDTQPPEPWLYFALAVVGGYGDAASVILAKAFTGHVTGSLLLAAIAIAAHEWKSLAEHLSAVLFFLVGVVSSVVIERILITRPFLKTLPTVLGIEVILTSAAYLALAVRVAPRVEIFIICVSLALGIQNGAFQRTGGISVHMIPSPDHIGSVLKQAFDTPGPVLVGVHVDYRDIHKLFEEVNERSVH
ncbi:DUF1275 family protein [Tunturibacter psychrotolerans]|uniref:DUF1275 family protein n=1 Tax=Tunturiibacter psychrotolerans TaxID=3069686 RepID=A0AAU7ZJC4_9BACT